MEETLKEILKQLGEMRTDIGDLKKGQTRLESDIGELRKGQVRLEKGQIHLESDMKSQFKAVLQAIVETEDTADEKIAENSAAIKTLNKRVFTMETTVTRLEDKQA